MEAIQHKKVLIIGCSGAGKSTLSRKLAMRWGLPLHHLDVLYWNEGWMPTPKQEFRKLLKDVITQPEWIVDGNFDSSLEMRAHYADLIIFLDFPNWLCLSRVTKRFWSYRGQTRPDMAQGCPEKIDMKFVRWIWRYPKDARPGVLEILQKAKADVVLLKTSVEVERWLDSSPQRNA
ncbi:adenylate kinase [Sporosarcina sp. ANT_H38]|uniref:adenylate kinase n=1 Tax=Sporosarcina sp. ANT_H38 TaxID=2597358 RepID=UPI0011F2F6AA|nr:adenylate kinase [Sporosarcina sp. ANT_H38]KAA0948474.1 adenylate kinase [Sporosarcina sp. ANT_H38]